MGQSPGPGRTYNQLAGTSVERLSGISDGIFSVGMTLLVLGLAVPALSTGAATEGQLWSALAKLGPNVLVYVMSFMTLGIFGSARAPSWAALRAATATTSGFSSPSCSR
jgi:uncharacterized membrane protein